MQFIIHKLDRAWAGQQCRALGGALENPIVDVVNETKVKIGGLTYWVPSKAFSTPKGLNWPGKRYHEGPDTTDLEDFAEWLHDYAEAAKLPPEEFEMPRRIPLMRYGNNHPEWIAAYAAHMPC
jgi:hypothetical protein